MTEESEVLENVEVRQMERRFLPVITQGIMKYHSIGVEDPKIKGGALFHKELQKMLSVSEPRLTLDLVTLHPHPPLDDVTLQRQPPFEDVTLQPQPLLEVVSNGGDPS